MVAREDEPGETRLVAYVVGATEAAIDAGELRDYLKPYLPDYMIPSAIVVLDALPLTPNGKLDRRGLPAPEGRQEAAGYVAPRTPEEEVLASIWAEVLRLDRVGIEDNFFELGGPSLLATRIMARVRDSFSVELPLRLLLGPTPTIHELAEQVEAARRDEHGMSLALEAHPRMAFFRCRMRRSGCGFWSSSIRWVRPIMR